MLLFFSFSRNSSSSLSDYHPANSGLEESAKLEEPLHSVCFELETIGRVSNLDAKITGMTLSSYRQQNLGFHFILFNFVPKSINTFKNVSLL